MKPLLRHNKILLSVNASQKDDYLITLPSGVQIWMRSNYGFDGKQTKPVLAKVYSVPDDVKDLTAGDFVLAHYNTFKRYVTEDYLYGDTGEKDSEGLAIFSVEMAMIYLKLDEQGNAYPLPGYTTVERVPEVIKTSLILPETCADKTHMTMFKVVNYGGPAPKMGLIEAEEEIDIAPDDIIICYKHSDLQINYTWLNESRSVIRVRNADINAVSKPEVC